MQFIKKPPVVEAVQWDGTLGGVRTVIDAIKDRRLSCRYEARFHNDEGMRGKLYIEGLNLRDVFEYLSEGDWLVFDPDSGPHCLSDERFKATYDPVEES